MSDKNPFPYGKNNGDGGVEVVEILMKYLVWKYIFCV